MPKDGIDLQELRRQVRGHLDSLRRAGVEWLPVSREPAILTLTQPRNPEPAPVETSGGGAPSVPAVPDAACAGGLEDRRQALTVLSREVAACGRCSELASKRTQTVFGQGEAGVELCFVGEAPGADEDAQGLPFVGAAGQLLNKIITACGLKREEVYICNVLKCRPPGNRTPLPDEAANCRPFLERQLELVQPKFICTLGGCAAQNLLQTSASMGSLRGKFHDYKGIPVLCTYHPAYLLPHRHPEKKRDVWEDMKMLLARMGRPVPQK